MQDVKDMSKKFPQILSKLKARRGQYNDIWKTFLRKLIMSVDYFKDLKNNTIEELIYSLKQELIEPNHVITKVGECIDRIYFISSGIVQMILKFDDGTEIIIDQLRQGCSFGLYSILETEPGPIMFKIKAKTSCTLQ